MIDHKSSRLNAWVFVEKIVYYVFRPLTVNGFFASWTSIFSTSRLLIGVKSKFAGLAVSAVIA